MSGWQTLFCRVLTARVGFAEWPMSGAGKPPKIELPATTSGRTPPSGAAAVCRRAATEQNFEDVVKSAEQAPVLVLVC
jgi:hypothetical protein